MKKTLEHMMRKSLLIFFSALAIMMAGCTKDVDTKAPVHVDDAWMYDESLPVPVQFGTSSVMTKAMIESSSDMIRRNFKVYAFNRNPQSVLTANDGLMLRDADATCVAQESKAVLRLNSPYYYPQNSNIDFCFYSYYTSATSDDLKVSVDHRHASVVMPVAVTNDILWAKSVADREDGYNADYLRGGNPMPSFKFSHPAACVSFTASLEHSVSDALSVSRVVMKGIPVMAELCIVDYDNPENEGCFVQNISYGNKFLTNTSSANLRVTLSTTPKQLGQEVLIVPCEFITLMVYLAVDGKEFSTPVEYVIKPDEGFEAGYRYEFNLKVYSPQKIEVDIDVDSYESAFGGGDYDPDAYN